MKVDRRVCSHKGGVLNIWIRIGDRGPEGEGEGGQKQRTKKKKGSAYNSYFHLAYYKNYTVDFQKRCEQNGLAS